MALYPHTFTSKETLQPGARGEGFNADLPGYRTDEKRINRTNMKLSTSLHDVPNIKWEMDSRLPVLFRYGYAYGYNQMVMPKGRIAAIDPNMNQLDRDTHKSYNVLTLANGGNLVKLREKADGVDHTQWEKAVITSAGEGTEEDPIKLKVNNQTISIDENTGKVALDGIPTDKYRFANKPIGMIQRNEYTRDDNSYNGMQPGAVLTDAMVELPLFIEKEKAEANPWGSIYGTLLPGDLVKADENGRLISSPLNSVVAMTAAGLTTAADIEIERQQVVGQVYDIQRDLLPAGAARYAQWALSDRMKFDQFNPEMFRGNNRRGEDINENSPYGLGLGGAINGSTPTLPGKDHYDFKGHPYDQTMSEHDLHMLASSSRKSDLRFGLAHQLENGIPGLTDGYNAVVREYSPEKMSEIRAAAEENSYTDMFMKMSEVDVVADSINIAITTKLAKDLKDSDFQTSKVVAGSTLKASIGTDTCTTGLKAKYCDALQGFVVIEVADAKAFHTFITKEANATALKTSDLNVYVKFSKRGMSGVPTNLDWDGCQGTVSILLQK